MNNHSMEMLHEKDYVDLTKQRVQEALCYKFLRRSARKNGKNPWNGKRAKRVRTAMKSMF